MTAIAIGSALAFGAILAGLRALNDLAYGAARATQSTHKFTCSAPFRRRGNAMLKQRRELATQVADCLFAAERAIDAAISRTAHLVGLMPAVREDANLSAMIGQGAIKQAIEAMAALGEARQGIVETHRELSVAQHQIGLGAIAFGGDNPKPDDPALEARLRPVRHAA